MANQRRVLFDKKRVINYRWNLQPFSTTSGSRIFFDILLISFMIYGLLVWFRDAASRFVLVGIGILGIIYYLAARSSSYLSAAVLQGFSPSSCWPW